MSHSSQAIPAISAATVFPSLLAYLGQHGRDENLNETLFCWWETIESDVRWVGLRDWMKALASDVNFKTLAVAQTQQAFPTDADIVLAQWATLFRSETGNSEFDDWLPTRWTSIWIPFLLPSVDLPTGRATGY